MATFYTDPAITSRGFQQPDLLDTYSRLMQIKSLQDSRRTRDIQDNEARLRLKALQQQQADEQAMRTAAAAGVSHMSVAGLPLGGAGSPVGPPGDTTSFDRQAMLSSLAGSAPHLVPGAQTQFEAQDKADAAHQEALLQLKDKAATLDEKTLKNLKTRTDMMGSLAQSVIMNPASYASAKAMAEQQGMVKPGQLPPQFSPQLLPQLQAWANQARDVKDVITEEETKRHNVAMEGKKNEPEQDISDWLASKSLPDTPTNRTTARNAIAARKPAIALDLQSRGTPETPLNSKQQATAQAILEGRMTPPSSFALKTPYWQNIMGEVFKQDPQFSEQRAQLRKSFTQDKEIGAINTALGHVGVLNDAIDSLNSGKVGVNALNSIAQKLGVQVGATPVTTFNTIVHRVGPEIAKAYIGAGGSAGERGADEKDFDPALGTAQLKSNTAVTAQLLRSKISSKAFQWNQNKSEGMPSFEDRFIMPEAKATLNKLSPQAGGLKVGQIVTVKGKQMKVTAVHPDGSFDAE